MKKKMKNCKTIKDVLDIVGENNTFKIENSNCIGIITDLCDSKSYILRKVYTNKTNRNIEDSIVVDDTIVDFVIDESLYKKTICITLELPSEFINHYKLDKFRGSFERLIADSKYNLENYKDLTPLAGNYEIEVLEMLNKAFEKSSIVYMNNKKGN